VEHASHVDGAISGLAIGLVSVSAPASELSSSGDLGGSISATVHARQRTDRDRVLPRGVYEPFRGLHPRRDLLWRARGNDAVRRGCARARDSPELLLYTGELVITTPSGDLTIQDRGVLNAVDGSFFEFDEIVDGTRAFTGVSGLLFSQGTSTPTGFDGTISGQICGGPPGPPVLD